MESSDAGITLTGWKLQGCGNCRAAWSTANRDSLRLLGTNCARHARVYVCSACGAYWDENERYASQVTEGDAHDLLKGADMDEKTQAVLDALSPD